MNYVLMFIGLFILILIPEYASTQKFILQGLGGLLIFTVGAINIIAENDQ